MPSRLFDANNNQLASASGQSRATAWTAAAWVRVDEAIGKDTSVFNAIVLAVSGTTPFGMHGLRVAKSGNRWLLSAAHDMTTTDAYINSVDAPLATFRDWLFVAATHVTDGVTPRLFIGTPTSPVIEVTKRSGSYAAGSGSSVTATSTYYVGSYGANNQLKGCVAWAAWWNSAELSVGEIDTYRAETAVGRWPNVRKESLFGLWPLGEASGTASGRDLSVSGKTLTASNFATGDFGPGVDEAADLDWWWRAPRVITGNTISASAAFAGSGTVAASAVRESLASVALGGEGSLDAEVASARDLDGTDDQFALTGAPSYQGDWTWAAHVTLDAAGGYLWRTQTSGGTACQTVSVKTIGGKTRLEATQGRATTGAVCQWEMPLPLNQDLTLIVQYESSSGRFRAWAGLPNVPVTELAWRYSQTLGSGASTASGTEWYVSPSSGRVNGSVSWVLFAPNITAVAGDFATVWKYGTLFPWLGASGGFWKFDEAAGDAADSSGNGRTLTGSGSPGVRPRTPAPPLESSTSLTLTGVPDCRIFQRQYPFDWAQIPIAGTYGGSPSSIEARFTAFGVTPGGWTTINGAPSGGTYSGMLTVNTGQGVLEVRANQGGSYSYVRRFGVGVGDVYFAVGTSNASGVETGGGYNRVESWLTDYEFGKTFPVQMSNRKVANDTHEWHEIHDPTDAYSAASTDMPGRTNSIYGPSSSWVQSSFTPTDTTTDTSTTGAGKSVWPVVASLIMENRGVPVAIIPVARGTSNLASWTDTASLYWNDLRSRCEEVAGVGNIGDSTPITGFYAIGVLAVHGENNYGSDPTQYEGSSALAGSIAYWTAKVLSNLNLTTWLMVTGDWPGTSAYQFGQAPNDGITRVRKATQAVWGGAVFAGPVMYDLDLADGGGSADGFHYRTQTELDTLAKRWYAALGYVYGDSIDIGRGPRIVSCVRAGTTVTVKFDTTLDPASTLDGISVYDGTPAPGTRKTYTSGYTAATASATPAEGRGTWVLEQIDSGADLTAKTSKINTALATFDVAGFSMRVPWNAIDNNDFSLLAAGKALADAQGKEFCVRFMAGRHTPAHYRGATWTSSALGVWQAPCPFDPADGTLNDVFVAAYDSTVTALAAWCRANGVKVLHLPWYGLQYSEIYDGGDLQAVTNYTDVRWRDGHYALMDIAKSVSGPDLCVEYPMSGYWGGDVTGGVDKSGVNAGPVMDYAEGLWPNYSPEFAMQTNGYGSANAGTFTGSRKINKAFQMFQALNGGSPWDWADLYRPGGTAPGLQSIGAQWLEIYTDSFAGAGASALDTEVTWWAGVVADEVKTATITLAAAPSGTVYVGVGEFDLSAGKTVPSVTRTIGGVSVTLPAEVATGVVASTSPAPATVAVAATVQAPVVSIPKTVTPSVVTAATTVQAPTVKSSPSVPASAVSVSATVRTVTIAVTASVTVQPAAVTVAVTPLAPTIIAGANTTVSQSSAVTATVTPRAATPRVDVTVTSVNVLADIDGVWVLHEYADTAALTNATNKANMRAACDVIGATGKLVGICVRFPWNQVDLVNDPSGAAAYLNAVIALRDYVRVNWPNVALSIRMMAGKYTPSSVTTAGPYYTYNGSNVPVPWTSGTLNWNTAYENAYAAQVAALASWCRSNSVKLLHLCWYGRDYSELSRYGQMTGVTFGTPPGLLNYTAPYSSNAAQFTESHKRLINLSWPVGGDDLVLEYPLSGMNIDTGATNSIRNGLADEMVALSGGNWSPRCAMQANGWGGMGGTASGGAAAAGDWGASSTTIEDQADTVWTRQVVRGEQDIAGVSFSSGTWATMWSSLINNEATYCEIYDFTINGLNATYKSELNAQINGWSPAHAGASGAIAFPPVTSNVLTPTIQASSNQSVTVTPSAVAVAATVQTTTRTASSMVTPATTSATATVLASTRTTTATVTPSPVAASVSQPNATYIASATIPMSAVTATVSVPVSLPLVVGTVSPATVVVAATARTATPVVAVTVTPAPVTASGTVQTATVAGAVTVKPAAVTAAATVQTATLTSSATVTPLVVAAAAVAQTPGITAGSSVTYAPATVQLSASVPAPTEVVIATVTPTAATSSTTVTAPTPVVTVTVTSSTVTGAAAVLSSTQTATATIAAAASSVSAVVLSPSVFTGTSTTVAAYHIGVTTSIHAPSQLSTATAAPGLVAVAAQVRAVAVQITGPTTVTVGAPAAAAVAVPAVTVSTGATVANEWRVSRIRGRIASKWQSGGPSR